MAIPAFSICRTLPDSAQSLRLRGVAASPNLNFFAFDLLYLNGYDLRKAAFIDRRHF